MALDARLLRSSFSLVAEKKPDVIHRFYEILFERYPAARALFKPERMRGQEHALLRALSLVIEHVDDATWLTDTLIPMGARHVRYGVTEEMYAWVGDGLLATLAEAAGDAWTAELQGCWSDAYAAISALMLQGAKSRAA